MSKNVDLYTNTHTQNLAPKSIQETIAELKSLQESIQDLKKHVEELEEALRIRGLL